MYTTSKLMAKCQHTPMLLLRYRPSDDLIRTVFEKTRFFPKEESYLSKKPILS